MSTYFPVCRRIGDISVHFELRRFYQIKITELPMVAFRIICCNALNIKPVDLKFPPEPWPFSPYVTRPYKGAILGANIIDLGKFCFIKTKRKRDLPYFSKAVTCALCVKFQRTKFCNFAKKIRDGKIHILASIYVGNFRNLIQIFTNYVFLIRYNPA